MNLLLWAYFVWFQLLLVLISSSSSIGSFGSGSLSSCSSLVFLSFDLHGPHEIADDETDRGIGRCGGSCWCGVACGAGSTKGTRYVLDSPHKMKAKIYFRYYSIDRRSIIFFLRIFCFSLFILLNSKSEHISFSIVYVHYLVVVCVGLLGVNRLTRGSIKHPRKFVQIFDRSWNGKSFRDDQSFK